MCRRIAASRRYNERDLAWTGNANWTLTTDLELLPHHLQHQQLDLVFDGLDTVASIFVNAKSALQTANAFRQEHRNVHITHNYDAAQCTAPFSPSPLR